MLTVRFGIGPVALGAGLRLGIDGGAAGLTAEISGTRGISGGAVALGAAASAVDEGRGALFFLLSEDGGFPVDMACFRSFDYSTAGKSFCLALAVALLAAIDS